jgi:hypothetical protein
MGPAVLVPHRRAIVGVGRVSNGPSPGREEFNPEPLTDAHLHEARTFLDQFEELRLIRFGRHTAPFEAEELEGFGLPLSKLLAATLKAGYLFQYVK